MLTWNFGSGMVGRDIPPGSHVLDQVLTLKQSFISLLGSTSQPEGGRWLDDFQGRGPSGEPEGPERW